MLNKIIILPELLFSVEIVHENDYEFSYIVPFFTS